MIVALVVLCVVACIMATTLWPRGCADADARECFSDGEFYPAKEIVPKIWIGSLADSFNEEFMERHRIGLVVNCTVDIPRAFEEIDFIRVPVNDRSSDAHVMLEHLETATNAMSDAAARDVPILVHCFAGVSRSASVVAAYLVRSRDMTPTDAMALIKAKKPETFSNGAVFLSALERFHIQKK